MSGNESKYKLNSHYPPRYLGPCTGLKLPIQDISPWQVQYYYQHLLEFHDPSIARDLIE